MAENILIAVLGGGNLLLFIKFLIERHDKKKSENVSATLLKLEKDSIRIQLLVLMLLQPDEETEILKVGEYYFNKLHANWYLTSMFKKWCDTRGLEPDWFDNKE